MAAQVRRLAAILVADMVGYSRLMGLDEAGTLARLKAHRSDRIEPILERRHGRLVKLTGDGALVEFASAVDALTAGIEIQQAVADANLAETDDRRIVFRIGLHVGDLIVDGDDLYGDGVNVAARLEAAAAPGGILVSSNLRDAVVGRLAATFADVGGLALKNIDRPIQAFRVEWQAADWPTAIFDASSRAKSERARTPEAPRALPDKPSIAVLPFDNMSGDPDQAYFADGIAEDLITGLSRVSWLFVMARNSSFSLRGEKLDIATIGRRLGVRYLVEGSVRRSGQRVRLTAQLVEASSAAHLWADKFDGPLDEMFDFQDKVTSSIIGAIEPKLRSTEIARSRRKPPENMDAFDLVLQAMPKHTAMSATSVSEAIVLLDRAIALAPDYGHALAIAAWCRAARRYLGYSPDAARDFREATTFAKRALEIDSNDPIALRAAGITAVILERDYQTGWDLMDRALAIEPNSAISWGQRGWIDVWAGKPESGIEAFQTVFRLSPFDQQYGGFSVQGMACALTNCDRFEEGLLWARKAVQANPDWLACQRQLVASLWLCGHREEAKAAADKCRTLDPSFSLGRTIENSPFRRTATHARMWDAMRDAGLPP